MTLNDIVSLLLVAFLALNLLAWVVLGFVKNRTRARKLAQREHQLSIICQIDPSTNVEQVREILGCLAQDQSGPFGAFRMVYTPFTEHKDVAFRSKYLNTTEDGIRWNGADGPETINDLPRENRTLMLGGSTTFGYGVADDETIPAVIEQELNKLSGGIVINSARQSYYSSLEVIQFLKWLQEGQRFDQVVLVDGLNDVFHNFPELRNRSRFSDVIEFQMNSKAQGNPGRQNRAVAGSVNLLKGVVEVLTMLPIVQLLSRTLDRVSVEVTRRSGIGDEFPTEPWTIQPSRETVDPTVLGREIADLTSTNWKAARAIGEAYSISVKFVLQPTYAIGFPMEKHRFLPARVSPKLLDTYSIYYSIMKDRWGGDPDFIDLSDTFDASNICPFIDICHYSRAANRLIAQNLAPKLVRGNDV